MISISEENLASDDIVDGINHPNLSEINKLGFSIHKTPSLLTA